MTNKECDKKCIGCKNFTLKIMLNGFDGICEKHMDYIRFNDSCDDFEKGEKYDTGTK